MAGFGLRKNQRFKDSVPVRFRGKEVVGEGMLKDLSLTGGSISGDVHVSTGMTLGLQLFFPGDREPLLIDRAVVQWVKGMEFGVELTASPQIAERLTRLISEKVKKKHGPSKS
ncbi:MAG TPA: PilZ domain-containing protein [Nitrospira sp.]|nr:PilZ domain-containing protein [Nitrospira sp.]